MIDWKQIEGQWSQLEFQVRAKWIKLTDDDIAVVAGKRDALVDKLQQRYALVKDDAEKQVNQWFTKVSLAHGKAVAARAAAAQPAATPAANAQARLAGKPSSSVG